MLSRTIWAFGGAAAFVLGACGSVDQSDLFSAGASSTKSDAGTSSGTDAGTRDSGSGGGGGGTADAGGGGPIDSGVIPPPTTGLYCGDNVISGDPTTCTGSDICCVTGEQQGAPTYACGAESPCRNNGDLVIPCDNSAECGGGKICCGTFVTSALGNYYSQVRCASSCGGTNARTFCDPNNGDADCAGVSATSTCAASTALPGFHACTTN